MTKQTQIPMVDSWNRRRPTDGYVYADGKNIKLNLKKFLPKSSKRLLENNLTREEITSLETLIIERKLFFNKTDMLCQYIDYFCEFFDEEKELPTAILYIKKQLDSRTDSLSKDEFITLLMRRLFHETSIKRLVYEMVDYNYNLDVTVDKKSGRVFNGYYDFTNDDSKALLAISIIMKFVIPLTSQYIATNTLYTDDTLSGLITDVFMEIFFRAGDYRNSDPDLILLKLYKFTEEKITKHSIDHQALWNQQSALRGLTENKHVDTILIKHLISNNMFKFRFDDNIVSFMKSIVETQLICTINKVKYKADPVHVDSVKDINGLSGIDKLEQSLAKLDETTIIRCEKSLSDIIDNLEKEVGHISQEEIAYYGVNFVASSAFHSMLLGYMFAKDFNGYVEMKNMNIFQHMKLLVVAKRRLTKSGYVQLPYLFSSVTRGRTSMRLLQNTKFTNKLESSSVYDKLMNDKYPTLNGYKDETVLGIISQVLNNIYTYVEYEHQELTGEIIEFNEDVISDELMNFIDSI